MKTYYYTLGFLINCLLVDSSSAQDEIDVPKFTIKVHVVKENGDPVDGATVVGSFLNFSAPKERSGDTVEKVTNAKGEATVVGKTHSTPGIQARLEGWYESTAIEIPNADKTEWDKLEAERTVRLTLRKRTKPIPMYARNVDVVIPKDDVKYGFDFAIGELVKPHGAGRSSDVFLSVKTSEVSREDFNTSLIVSFPLRRDGILEDPVWLPESRFRGSYHCPVEGDYRNEKEYSRGAKRGVLYTAEERRSSLFRIKSVEKDGKLISANYGKILGSVRIISTPNAEGARIGLGYYLNLRTNDTNLELDMNRNVSKDHTIRFP